jgi:His/Glu/Gln/Arg/opine family amino acid ABC transporter permease subunit
MAAVVEARIPPGRGLRYFATNQNPWSWASLVLGNVTLLFVVAGTFLVLNAFGWTQVCPDGAAIDQCARTDPLAAGLTSDGLGMVIGLTLIAGAATAVVGFVSWQRYETKSAKEATIIGIVLALQGAALALFLWWFRGSDVDRFVRNFLDIALLDKYKWGDIVPTFLNGAKNTLILSVLGAVIGFSGGLLLAVFTMSKRAVVRAPARIYINFFRGTPLIWQISFAGLGIVAALRLDLSPYTVAFTVLGLNLAAYSSEVYRAGIQSLERGQIEAARTLGLGYFQAMRYVIVPQAIRRVIPPLLNEFVILIKDTSLVSVLGLTLAQKELLGVGRDIYNSTFNATAFLGSAAGYLIITLPMIGIVTLVERRLRSGLTSVVGA